jgi:broad specificity phosphatase PhoE
MLMRVILVRHASTAWSGVRYCGVSDPPLSEAGEAEANRLALELAPDLSLATRVVSSASRRAVATATVIAAAAGLRDVEVDDRWREADVGIAEGRTFDELAALAPGLASALADGVLAIDWPGGETHASLAGRVHAAWTDVVAAGRPAVVVTHAGPFLHARALAADRPPSTDDLVCPAFAVRLTVTEAPDRPVLPSRA